MRKCRLTNFSEGRTLGILERSFRGTSYVAHPKVRLADVVAPDDRDELEPGDRDYLLRAHLDFVVCDRSQAMAPVFAVEFDGPSHYGETQRARDIRKNRLCMGADLPLLRVGDAEIQEHDRLTLLGHMMTRALAWPTESASIRAEIDARIEEELGADASEDRLRRLVAPDGFLDPTYDASFHFDRRHYFRGISDASTRLWRNHRIASPYPSKDTHEWVQANYILFPHERRMEMVGGSHLHTVAFEVRRSDGRLPHEVRRPDSEGADVMFEDRVQFSMQWLLPLHADYDWTETPADYLARTGRTAWGTTDLPGVFIPFIAESFTDYLCLRAVENWATESLPRARRVTSSG